MGGKKAPAGKGSGPCGSFSTDKKMTKISVPTTGKAKPGKKGRLPRD